MSILVSIYILERLYSKAALIQENMVITSKNEVFCDYVVSEDSKAEKFLKSAPPQSALSKYRYVHVK